MINRPFKNVGEAGKTRQKQPRKRSLGVLNEHDSLRFALRAALKRVSRKRLAEAVFNDVLPTQVVLKRPVKGFPLAALTLALVGLQHAHAMDVTLGVGQSSESEMVYRLGLQWDFQRSWWETSTGRLTGYWDAAYSYWQGDQTSSNHSLSLSPVFVYEFAGERFRPYIEAGIGVAAFADTEIEDRDLGSSFQFEDRLGLGVRFGADQDLGLRVIHYSNAGLKNPNDGVEVYSLYYRMGF